MPLKIVLSSIGGETYELASESDLMTVGQLHLKAEAATGRIIKALICEDQTTQPLSASLHQFRQGPPGPIMEFSVNIVYTSFQIFSAQEAFALVKADGSVITWGNANGGGNSSAVQPQLKDVRSISSTCSAFAALKADIPTPRAPAPECGGDI